MIREFIQSSFRERAERAGALFVYDGVGCFRDILRSMSSESCTVIDAGDSYIEAEERAVEIWARAGDPKSAGKCLIAYIPYDPPQTDEERCHDPFAALAAGADWFPRTDDDSFLSLCERAKPDHKEKIRKLFAHGIPPIAVIEAVGGGKNWPQLQTVFGVESVADLVVALLAPNPEQKMRMKSDDAWIAEASELLSVEFGFSPKTKSKKWEAIVEELWRLVLFSEFAFDQPQALPSSLASVPIASSGSADLVKRVCDILRSEPYYPIYIPQADRTVHDLRLESRIKDIQNFGERDTFAFEERSFLRSYVGSVLAGDFGSASSIAEKREKSVWVKYTDRGMLWTIATRARELVAVAEDLQRDLAANCKNLGNLGVYYISRGYRLDQAHREMEGAIADAFGEIDGLEDLIEPARKEYQTVAEKLQTRLVELVTKEGWPIGGWLRATQIFDRHIAPLLETRGTRVAFFFIDALRFEVAVALERQLTEKYTCHLHEACAQLPTITPVGMAALLPKADGNLRLSRHGNELVPTLSSKPIRIPQDRFAYVRDFYGDRTRMIDLDELLKPTVGGKKKAGQLEGVELLLVKTTDIDEQGELDAGNIRNFLPHILQKLIASIGKLKRLGFRHAVLCTDHGFVLLAETEAGSVAQKPSGDWLQIKDRCLLGSGSANADTVRFDPKFVGINGDFESYVVPRTFATFSKRTPYFHEGLSLSECILPILEVDLGNQEAVPRSAPDLQLRYRGKDSGTITSQRPVVEIIVFGGELFEGEIGLRLEAVAQGKLVGEAAACPYVDPATGVVKLKAGRAVKVPLRINEDFRGTMEVRAVDADTSVAYGSPLTLTTAYLE
jgi:hypothetical protein